MKVTSNKEDVSAQDVENHELMEFASADCALLGQKKKAFTWITALNNVMIPFKAIGYLVFLPFWSQRLTFTEIRQFRETFLPDPGDKHRHCGIVSYYFVNWLAWHAYRHIKKVNLDLNDGKHAWEIVREVWMRTFAKKGGTFFHLFSELRPRAFEEFLNRDKTFFMSANGNIFSKDAREALYYILMLSHRGNKFIRLLYGWACELIDRKFLDMENLSKIEPIVNVLFEDRERRMEQIKNIRRDLLERIETYAANMLHDAVDRGETECATSWNDVVCRVRELKGFRPMPDNLGQLAEVVSGLIACFNTAAQRTYVCYLEYAPVSPAQSQPEEPTAPDVAKEEPVDPRAEIKVYGRFRIEITKTHYRITDTRQKMRSYKIKKDIAAGDAVRQLILTYNTGTDQTHPSSRAWNGAFQGGRGDATRFKSEQIFMLPRWNAEKHEFMPRQYTSRWRLWMDDELSLTKNERVQRFIATHPNGLPV